MSRIFFLQVCVILCFIEISRIDSFYFEKRITSSETDDSFIVNNLNFDFTTLSSKFPNEFSIEFVDLKTSDHLVQKIYFSKAFNDSQTTGYDVYLMNNSNDLIKYSSSRLEYESYKQVNGNGFSTLVKEPENKFKIIATVSSVNNNDNELVYDIIPIEHDKYLFKRKTNIDQFVQNNNDVELNDIKQEIIRQKRSNRGILGQPICLYVELLVVVDDSIFNSQRFKHTSPNMTLQLMQVYYSHFFNGVNMQFQNSLRNDSDLQLNIKLKNFLFMNNSEWTNSIKYGVPNYFKYNGREVLQASLALNAFQKYMNNDSQLPFKYDIAISLIDKDLWSGTSPDTSSILGLSTIGGVCTSSNLIIMEEIGGFAYISVASREIAKNLGSYDDGVSSPSGFSDCPAINGNLMNENYYVITKNNQFAFKFSKCTIRAFKSFLLNPELNAVSKNGLCLANIPTSNNSYPNQLWNAYEQCQLTFGKNSLFCSFPGQIWSPNDQCKMINGNNSRYCNSKSNSICTALYCTNSTDDSCMAISGSAAAEGTSCDSGKICLNNECVNSSLAPLKVCVFEDQLIYQSSLNGIKLKNSSIDCETYLLDYYANSQYDTGYGCSNPYIKNQCCHACQKYLENDCFDTFATCDSLTQYCQTQNIISKACPKTCKLCGNITCKSANFVCQNGGNCVNQTTNNLIGFKCECPLGYYGSLCQYFNPCVNNPCKNNFACTPIGSLGKYICDCPKECASDLNCSACACNEIRTTGLMQSSSSFSFQNRPTTLDLNITFNLTYINDYQNLDSAASQNLILNFKTYLNDVLKPIPISIYVIRILNGSVSLQSTLQFSCGINLEDITRQIINSIPPKYMGNIIPGSVTANVINSSTFLKSTNWVIYIIFIICWIKNIIF